MPMTPANTHVVEGTVERIIYLNEQDGYTVARVACQRGTESVTIVGYLADIREGEYVRAHGGWEETPKFGPRFRVTRFDIVPPSSVEGIEKYLSSGLIRGIGPVIAERIVKRFGADTLRVISEQPERLRQVQGIGRKTLTKITSSWEQHREARETMVFLQAQGITPTYATKIIKHYGNSTMRVVSENPYRLSYDIHGIGFRQADRRPFGTQRGHARPNFLGREPLDLAAGRAQFVGLRVERGAMLAAAEEDNPARLEQ